MGKSRLDSIVREEQRMERAQADWSLQLTLLARERTFNSWVRTALASLAVGVGISRLIDSDLHPWIIRTIGGLFVLCAVAILGLALWRYRHGYHDLRAEGAEMTPFWISSLLITALLLCSILAFFLVFEIPI